MAESKDVREKAQNLITRLKELVDEGHEKEVADGIIDVLEILAKRTRTPFDDLLLKMVRRWLDIPDND